MLNRFLLAILCVSLHASVSAMQFDFEPYDQQFEYMAKIIEDGVKKMEELVVEKTILELQELDVQYQSDCTIIEFKKKYHGFPNPLFNKEALDLVGE